MGFNIAKINSPGSHRFVGERAPDIEPSKVPIAGINAESIASALNGRIERAGTARIANAFRVGAGTTSLLYVSTSYAGYRKLAQSLFPPVPWYAEIDHVLSRSLAKRLGYRFVLIGRIPKSVNCGHGAFEKKVRLCGDIPPVCFADERVYDKILCRPPLARGRARVCDGYSVREPVGYGLTLRQKGIFWSSLGFDAGDNDALQGDGA